jgi:hypothetical protein
MGRAQGEALRTNIHDALAAISHLEAFRLMAPRYLPLAWFRRLAERKAARFLRRAFRAVPIDAAARFRGIAEGAAIEPQRLALCCLLEAVLSDLAPIVTAGPNGLQAGCSAVAVTGASSASGSPVLAHNFDYMPMVQPFFFIRRSCPHGKLRSLEFTISPLAGAVDGVNEAGLAITCNYAFVIDDGQPAPTITMIISEALATSRSVDEAVELFASRPRVGGGLLMIADSSGAIASLEISNGSVHRRDPEPGCGCLHHTNRLRCPAMFPRELPDQAHYSGKAPAALRGIRVHQSAEQRFHAISQRLQTAATALSSTDLHGIMSSHDGGPSADSVCMHGDYWYTTACTQLLPAERKLRASFSTACTAEFRDFTL